MAWRPDSEKNPGSRASNAIPYPGIRSERILSAIIREAEMARWRATNGCRPSTCWTPWPRCETNTRPPITCLLAWEKTTTSPDRSPLMISVRIFVLIYLETSIRLGFYGSMSSFDAFLVVSVFLFSWFLQFLCLDSATSNLFYVTLKQCTLVEMDSRLCWLQSQLQLV